MDPNNLNNNQGNMAASPNVNIPPVESGQPVVQGIPQVNQSDGIFGGETGVVNGMSMGAASVPPQASNAANVVPSGAISSNRGGSKIKEIIPLVLLSISTAAGVVCAIIFFLQWQEAQSDIDLKISQAQEEAKVAQKTEDEAIFEEREKEPNKTFAGPADYGGLTFSYPKTWSAYVNNDASGGGDFEAYLNPDVVNPITNEGGGSDRDLDDDAPIHALRVHIYDKSIDAVQKEYEEIATEGALSSRVYRDGDISGTLYEGTLEEGIEGRALIFKKNDKTIELRTDSSVFYDDFDKILKTVKVNKS